MLRAQTRLAAYAALRTLPRMSAITDRLRADLGEAMRARERATVSVLRTVLAAVANAESEGVRASAPATASDEVAGASVGVGTTEADRRVLTDDDVRAVISAECAERLDAAESLAANGAGDAAVEHRAAAERLRRYL